MTALAACDIPVVLSPLPYDTFSILLRATR